MPTLIPILPVVGTAGNYGTGVYGAGVYQGGLAGYGNNGYGNGKYGVDPIPAQPNSPALIPIGAAAGVLKPLPTFGSPGPPLFPSDSLFPSDTLYPQDNTEIVLMPIPPQP